MNIVLASGTKNDPTVSIALVQKVLAQEFADRGHRVSIVHGDDVGIRLNRLSEIEFTLKSAALSSVRSADVLDFKVGDGLFSTVVGRIFKRATPQLFVARSHGLDYINFEIKRKYAMENELRMSWRERMYYGGYLLWQVLNHMRLADICLFLNDQERDLAVNRLHIPASKAFVIDNGIPDYLLGLPKRQTRTMIDDDLRLAVIGTYVVRKINVAPKALNILLEKHPNLTVGFLGTGVDDDKILADYRPEFHNRIRNVKRFQHATLPSLLADYDAMFFPSMAEGFPLVAIEAMACGLAMIASNLSYISRRLEDGHDALFFERLNPIAMVAAVDKIIAKPGLLELLQRNGYMRAQDFSWGRIASETLEIYSDGLRKKAARDKSQN